MLERSNLVAIVAVPVTRLCKHWTIHRVLQPNEVNFGGDKHTRDADREEEDHEEN